jgi:hypothetical protein
VGLEQEDFQTVLRVAGKPEIMQENIQDRLEFDEGDPGFQLLTEEEIDSVIFFYLFSSALPIILNFPFIFSKCLSFGDIFCFINPDYQLIRMPPPTISPD